MNVARLQDRLSALGFQPGPVDGVAGPRTYEALFHHMGAQGAASQLAWSAADLFPRYCISDRPLRLAHWLGQWGHESAEFCRFEENLSYSAKRLTQVWPRRFPSLAAAEVCARNPEALANVVYGGRMGNTQPGDGWRYRGRGPMITGRDNYAAAARITGLPLLEKPELAADPRNFVLIACSFWDGVNGNAIADDDNLVLLTKRINGGSIGLADRRRLLEKAKRVLL